MSEFAFTLQVPAEPDYRALACEVAVRYVELRGGGDAERAGFTTALSAALDALAGTSGAGEIELVCRTTDGGLDITLRAGDRSSVVHHPLPAGKS